MLRRHKKRLFQFALQISKLCNLAKTSETTGQYSLLPLTDVTKYIPPYLEVTHTRVREQIQPLSITGRKVIKEGFNF